MARRYIIYHMAESLLQQLRSVAESFLILDRTQKWQFFKLFGKWARIAHSNEEYVALKFQGDPLDYYASFLVVGEARWNNLPFTLEGIVQHASYHWTLEILLR